MNYRNADMTYRYHGPSYTDAISARRAWRTLRRRWAAYRKAVAHCAAPETFLKRVEAQVQDMHRFGQMVEHNRSSAECTDKPVGDITLQEWMVGASQVMEEAEVVFAEARDVYADAVLASYEER